MYQDNCLVDGLQLRQESGSSPKANGLSRFKDDYGNFVKLLNFYSGKGSENRYETLWDGACSHA
jgi:hypothetical protein